MPCPCVLLHRCILPWRTLMTTEALRTGARHLLLDLEQMWLRGLWPWLLLAMSKQWVGGDKRKWRRGRSTLWLKMQLDKQGTVPARFQMQNKQHMGIAGHWIHAGHMGSHKAGNTGGWTCQWLCLVWNQEGWAALCDWTCGRHSDQAPPNACRGSWLWRPHLSLRGWKKTWKEADV